MSAEPQLGKPSETVGRKATGLRRHILGNGAMSAGPQLSKPSETAGRKANLGAKAPAHRETGAMPARLPDTLHPSKTAKKGSEL